MVLSGNRSLMAFAGRTGGSAHLHPVRPASFPFLDLATGQAWTVRPGGLWLFDPARRVPGTRARDYLAALSLLLAPRGAVAARALRPGTPLYRRLWETLVVSAMNGAPERVSARLFAAVVRETLLKGETACRPVMAADGLGAALVDPAVRFVAAHGGSLHTGTRIDGLDTGNARVTALMTGGHRVEVGREDSVILAVPGTAAQRLLPALTAPAPGPAIVNAHFRLGRAVHLPGGLPFLGLIGGAAEWIFQRRDVLSVTVSNADALAALPAEEVAARLWTDCARALRVESALPPVRVVKEKRATFDQTPAGAALRPGTRTGMTNLFLAGDWTDTGLPATLEGAVRSGDRAADAVLGRRVARLDHRMPSAGLALPHGRRI